MKKTISSPFTIIFKFIFTTGWIVGFGVATMSPLLSQGFSENTLIFGSVWILGSIFLFLYLSQMKKVEMDKDKIYVSNYFKTIEINKSEISDVTENIYLNFHPVWIHLNKTTEFGDKIMFMPSIRFMAYFTPHPTVEELKDFANIK